LDCIVGHEQAERADIPSALLAFTLAGGGGIGSATSRRAGYPLTPGLSTFAVNPHRFDADFQFLEKSISPVLSTLASRALTGLSRSDRPDLYRSWTAVDRVHSAFFTCSKQAPVISEMHDTTNARDSHRESSSHGSRFPRGKRHVGKAARRAQRMIIDRTSSTR